MMRLKISYSARKRVRCWRRTYLGKFSSRTSTGSPLSSKIFATAGPTVFSCSVRSGLESVLRLIRDLMPLTAALHPRFFWPARRIVVRGELQRPHQLVGATFAGQLLQPANRPVEVLGAEAVRRHDLEDRGVVGGPRALVGAEALFVQPFAGTETGVDDLDVRAGAQATGAHQPFGEVGDLHRLAHVEHVHVARVADGQRFDDE